MNYPTCMIAYTKVQNLINLSKISIMLKSITLKPIIFLPLNTLKVIINYLIQKQMLFIMEKMRQHHFSQTKPMKRELFFPKLLTQKNKTSQLLMSQVQLQQLIKQKRKSRILIIFSILILMARANLKDSQ